MKDHLNWELLGEAARGLKGEDATAVKDAREEVEEQEEGHLQHSTGWCRELWIQSLGLPAVLPPPEEEKEVKTAIGAARAKQARKARLSLASTARGPARLSGLPGSSLPGQNHRSAGLSSRERADRS